MNIYLTSNKIIYLNFLYKCLNKTFFKNKLSSLYTLSKINFLFRNFNDITLTEIASILVSSKTSPNSIISTPKFTKILAKIIRKQENDHITLSYLQILSKSLLNNASIWKICQPALKEMLNTLVKKVRFFKKYFICVFKILISLYLNKD